MQNCTFRIVVSFDVKKFCRFLFIRHATKGTYSGRRSYLKGPFRLTYMVTFFTRALLDLTISVAHKDYEYSKVKWSGGHLKCSLEIWILTPHKSIESKATWLKELLCINAACVVHDLELYWIFFILLHTIYRHFFFFKIEDVTLVLASGSLCTMGVRSGAERLLLAALWEFSPLLRS